MSESTVCRRQNLTSIGVAVLTKLKHLYWPWIHNPQPAGYINQQDLKRVDLHSVESE